MSLRVFVAGPPRTGTSTVCRALQEAGLFAVHGSDPVSDIPLAVIIHRAMQEGRDPFFYLARGIEAVADPCVTRSPKWDSSSYWPMFVPGFFRRLREANPECWVLLPSRPPLEWVSSIDRWKDLRSRLIKSDLPFLPPGRGRTDADLTEWYEDYEDRVHAEMAGSDRLVRFMLSDTDAPKIIEARTGIRLPWWGRLNAGPTAEELAAARAKVNPPAPIPTPSLAHPVPVKPAPKAADLSLPARMRK